MAQPQSNVRVGDEKMMDANKDISSRTPQELQPKPWNQPRRQKPTLNEMADREMSPEEFVDENSYTLPSKSIEEQAKSYSNFVGDAYYYLLNKQRVSCSAF